MPDKKSNLELAYDAFKLWIGDPKTRIPKLLIVAGIPLVASPWWQPVINGLVVKYLDVNQSILDFAETSLVVSGWLLILLGIVLYIRATRRPQIHLPATVNEAGSDLILDSSVSPSVQRNALTALGQLCTAAIDVPRVHLEGVVAEKQAETAARVKLIERNANDLASEMSVPAEYAKQAVRKFGERIIQEQINLDEVGARAAEQINQDAANAAGPATPEQDVPPINPDWLNQFEQEARNVSTEEMRLLFGRVLANEIQRPSSFSIKTVKLLRELDTRAAALFQKLCTCSISMRAGPQHLIDARVPALGGSAGSNSLQAFGLSFDQLNVLHEYGLIIPDYNSYFDYRMCILRNGSVPIGFTHQNSLWGLVPEEERKPEQDFRIHGVAFSRVGKELLPVVDIVPDQKFAQALQEFFAKQKLKMVPALPPPKAE